MGDTMNKMVTTAVNMPDKTNQYCFAGTLLLIAFFNFFYIFTVMKAGRKKAGYFTKEFMSQFDKEWEAAFPDQTEAPAGGPADDGNGYFAKKLPYKQWVEINTWQRA